MRPQVAIWALRLVATGLAMVSLVFCLNQVIMQVLIRDIGALLISLGIKITHEALREHLSSITLFMSFALTCSISGCVLSLVALYPSKDTTGTHPQPPIEEARPESLSHSSAHTINRPATPPPPYYVAIQLSAEMQPGYHLGD
nr:small hydrophobic protein [Avian metaavulavirus 6]UQT69499.1 small hydrophobic protein [Avian metaavulavirus 6]UQT69508.1 small hydrophobic protein [Avian metaavulavirus 6]UQT69517.1 small hydrophobic protein [Avian metaavulavirus 6]UQT69526.1 small hydrophobic protein [Avian metaavulavirus 6]